MAALPRKSDPDGLRLVAYASESAASLPWQTIALARGCASRECGQMTLQRFSLSSAAEVLDDEAGEEGGGVKVSFGFGDGYDEAAAARTSEAELKPASNGGGAGVAVEADIGEVGGKNGVVCKDQVAVIRVSAVVCFVLGSSAPVPDGQVGSGCPRSDTAEAERADEAGEVDGRVGAEIERADRFVEVSAHGHAAAIEIDGYVVVDGVLCCDQEGTTVVRDDLGGVGCGGLQCAAVNSGGSPCKCCFQAQCRRQLVFSNR